jgi:hypothetical protein
MSVTWIKMPILNNSPKRTEALECPATSTTTMPVVASTLTHSWFTGNKPKRVLHSLKDAYKRMLSALDWVGARAISPTAANPKRKYFFILLFSYLDVNEFPLTLALRLLQAAPWHLELKGFLTALSRPVAPATDLVQRPDHPRWPGLHCWERTPWSLYYHVPLFNGYVLRGLFKEDAGKYNP